MCIVVSLLVTIAFDSEYEKVNGKSTTQMTDTNQMSQKSSYLVILLQIVKQLLDMMKNSITITNVTSFMENINSN